MYRILAAHHGGVRERRDQLTHPAYAKPELLAERPNELWTLGHQQADGPGEVDVLLPVRDPRRVQPLHRRLDRPVPRERAARQGADRAGHRAAADHAQDPHDARRPRRADARQAGRVLARPTSASPRRISRPYTSSDNPYSEANFKTLKYRPEFPDRFDDIEQARASLPRLLPLVQPHPPPLRDRPDDPSRRPLRPRARSSTPPAPACSTPPTPRHPERFVRKPPAPPDLPIAAWINKPAETKEVAH